jgi:hypothetical protein
MIPIIDGINYEYLMFHTYHSWVPLWEAWKYNIFSHYLFNFLTYLKLSKNFQKSTPFWDMTPCSLAEVSCVLAEYQVSSKERLYLLLDSCRLLVCVTLRLCEGGVTSQKIVFFILTAMRTSNPVTFRISIYLWILLSSGPQRHGDSTQPRRQ